MIPVSNAAAGEPQASVAVPEPQPDTPQMPFLFYASIALPVFAVLLFLMMRLFPGPSVVIEEEPLPDDES